MSRHILRTILTKRPITVRNSLTTSERMEALSTFSKNEMNWYSCGPTVYDESHLGHARAYVTFDILRRLIEAETGVHVNYALGITDIDDKIITRAQDSGELPLQLARRYEARFFEDMAALNVLPPTRILRVTEHISDICEMVQSLERRGAAYATQTGNVYFSVMHRRGRYGQLDPSRGLQPIDYRNIDGIKTSNLGEKRDDRDFALWKRTSHDVNINADTPRWESPWGEGRPGWHIECAAMSLRALGPHLDVHTGGIDLRFPHHTNELATAEAHLGTTGEVRWAHTWLHAGHLHISGRKMSKSLKNFVSVRDYLQNGGCPHVFRTFCLLQRYSSPVEYSQDRVIEAAAWLSRVRSFQARDSMEIASSSGLPMFHRCPTAVSIVSATRDARQEVDAAIADDFDTPRLMRALMNTITVANKAFTHQKVLVSGPAGLAYEQARSFVAKALRDVGFPNVALFSEIDNSSQSYKFSSASLDLLVEFRDAVRTVARQNNMRQLFSLCDTIRDDAKQKLGISIEDSKGGASWRKV